MKAKSIKGKSSQEIQTAIHESMANGFAPNLAIVFSSVNQDNAKISSILDENSILVLGSTTGGEFIDSDFSSGSTAILLLEVDPSFFEIYLKIQRKRTPVSRQKL